MNEPLKVVLSLSLSGTLLILLLFSLRSLFKERLSKRWQYYIWLVAVARLLFPFAPETNLMATLFQGIDRATEQTVIVSPYTQQSGIIDSPQIDGVIDGQRKNDCPGSKRKGKAQALPFCFRFDEYRILRWFFGLHPCSAGTKGSII